MPSDDDSPTAEDWARLGAWLAERGHRLGGDAAPRRFASGLANLNYPIEIDGRKAVLRRPPPGPRAIGANDMKREYRVLSRLWRAYPLAPRAFLFCGDESVLGAEFLVMDYRRGVVVGGALPDAIEACGTTFVRLAEVAVDALADLHAVDPDAVSLGEFGRPQGFLGRQIDGWERRGLACYGGELPASMRAALDWLRRELPAENPPTLLHNDFKLDNMIVDPASLAAVAVLDWDMSTRGDPMIDLATLLAYWVEPGDPAGVHALGQMPSLEPGFPPRSFAVERYARRTGRPTPDLRFYRVLATLRLAVVIRQLYERYRSGVFDKPRYATFDRLAAALAAFALEIARGRYD